MDAAAELDASDHRQAVPMRPPGDRTVAMNDGRRSIELRLPSEPELRQRVYRALAQELAATTGTAALVFEASSTHPVPSVTASPPEVLEGLVATFPWPGTFGASPPARVVGAASDRLPETTWVLRPIEPQRPTLVATTVAERPAATGLLGTEGRLDVQTFWLGGRHDGRLWASRRVRFRAPTWGEVSLRSTAVARFAAFAWSRSVGVLCGPYPVRTSPREWAEARSRGLPRNGWLPVEVTRLPRTAEPALPDLGVPEGLDHGHSIALGSSGAGKTTFLADRAAQAIRVGRAVLALDLHGDLGPAIAARLGPSDRARLVAIDASRRPVVGIAALSDPRDRAAALFVAAVKRLSPDGGDVYWGFRLERVFDAFVRLVQESGGSLGDLYTLLTDADRREAARLVTRSRELGRFLDELAPIVRRTPEFLWSAAARLAKVALIPELAELLSPPDGGLPVEELLEQRRPVIVRIPFSSVGPEAASFAGSLVLARAYLGLAARRGPVGPHAEVLAVLDEVQGLSPRLTAEMLTEGRKFGLRLLVASQYPDRLAPELRLAAAGVARGVVAFRMPRASAASVGAWLGLPPGDAEQLLADLPVGSGVTRLPGSGELRSVTVSPQRGPPSDTAWREAAARTLAEFPVATPAEPAILDAAVERLLLAILAAEERGVPVPATGLVAAAAGLPGPAVDRAVLENRLPQLERQGAAVVLRGAWHLTGAGGQRLGLRAETGATRESPEHRALLLRAFRVFARHGAALEIVRQGRFDTTLPDARYRQLTEAERGGPPHGLAEAIADAQRGWAWRFFGGRDVHVEAEVSGALRPERVRHGVAKARARGAFVLFVVGDAGRAARVRRTLRAEGLRPDHAQVWTLGPPSCGRADGDAQGPKLPTGSSGP